MNLPRLSCRQRVIAVLASNLVATGLLLGILLAFDPSILPLPTGPTLA